MKPDDLVDEQGSHVRHRHELCALGEGNRMYSHCCCKILAYHHLSGPRVQDRLLGHVALHVEHTSLSVNVRGIA